MFLPGSFELVPYLSCKVRRVYLYATRLEIVIAAETICLLIGLIGQICTLKSNKGQESDHDQLK